MKPLIKLYARSLLRKLNFICKGDATVNTYNLEVFCLCVDKRNFTEVANLLSISQPAVSIHIRNLEEYFGVPLFERKNKQLFLTDAGHALYQFSRDYLQSIETLKIQMNQFQKGINGRVAVGASINLGRYKLPFILADFKQKHEHVDIRLIVEQPDTIVRMAYDGKIDFGYIMSIGAYPGLIIEPVSWVPQILIAAPNHPLANKDIINKDELQQFPIIASLRETFYMRTLEERLRESGIKDLHFAIQLGDTEGIKKGVQAGLGVGFVYRIAVETELELGILKEIKVSDLSLSSRIDLVYRAGKYISPVMKKTMDELSLKINDIHLNESKPLG